VPLYEYQCTKCHKRTEKIENVSGPHLKKCPHCAGKVERLQSAPAIQFKGTGWYVTDYSSKKTSGDGATPPTADSKDAPKESPSKESVAKESAGKESKEKRTPKKKE
jgi:putative FmdB family regulatory protein